MLIQAGLSQESFQNAMFCLRTSVQLDVQAASRSPIPRGSSTASDHSLRVSAGDSFLMPWSVEEPCLTCISHMPKEYGTMKEDCF